MVVEISNSKINVNNLNHNKITTVLTWNRDYIHHKQHTKVWMILFSFSRRSFNFFNISNSCGVAKIVFKILLIGQNLL